MKYLKVFTDFVDNIGDLGDAERGRLFTAMLEYARTGSEPELRGNERFLWRTAKKQIDNQRESYETRCTVNARNGSLGGKQTQANASEMKRTQAKSSDSLQDKDKEQETKEILTKVSTKKFVAPTLTEVEDYIAEKGLSVDGKKFFAYYDTPNANGEKWIDSKGQKVKNWKQKLLTWASHDGKEKPKGDYGFGNYQQKVVHMDELKNLI